MDFKGSKTEKNLYKIFSTKAMNYTRYMLFSEKARIDGYRWVEKKFEVLAKNELAHGREVYGAYLNLLGNTKMNIKESMYREDLNNETFYKAFEKEAKNEGFNDVMTCFQGLSKITENHLSILKNMDEILNNETNENGKEEGRWICMNCGYISEWKINNFMCPVCKYSRSHYKPY